MNTQPQYNPNLQQSSGMQQMQPQYGMQQQYGMNQQYGMQQTMPQQMPPKQNNFKEVIRTNYTTIALFEVSAGFDPSEQFPKAIAFVMGMPGQKDPSKQSGRTYIPANKITMKFSMQELKSLGQMLINLGMFKVAALKFEKHSDPSKNAYSQNQAQDTKKITASYDQAKDNIVITMNWGQKNVFIPIPLQDAFGLGHNLINVGNVADDKLSDHKIAHGLKNEEVTGIDYDPVGVEDPSHQTVGAQPMAQQMVQPQAGYQYQMQGQPQGQMQGQYNQQAVGMYQGMPGAQ